MSGATGLGDGERRDGGLGKALRLLLRLGVGTACLVGLSGTAAAHGPHATDGEPVAFAVVVGLPVVVGLGGGAVALRRVRADQTTPTGRRTGVALGVLLAVLGVTILASAAATSRWFGVAGGALGTLSGLWVARGHGTRGHGCHADVTLGAVSAHRLVEGVALGALYSAGAAVGLLAAVLLAGHTALETAAVSGMYAAGPVRSRAVGAVILVHVGNAVGAVAGLGVAWALPAWGRALALAAAGGALLVVGAAETRRAIGRGVWSRPGAT